MSTFQKLRDSYVQGPHPSEFTHCWDEIGFRDDVHNIDGYKMGKFPGRYYIVPPDKECSEQRAYPSATTILGQIGQIQGENDWLSAWRKAVGEEEADRISFKARSRGTAMHDMAELYLRNQEVDAYHLNGWKLFRELVPRLNKIHNIHCLEHALYSDILQVAGRVDCVAEYDEEFDRDTMDLSEFCGVLTLIDFKSSRREKSYGAIGGYKRQVSLYAMCFEERTGIRVEIGNILMGIDTMDKSKAPGVKPFDVFLGDYKKTTIDEIAMVHEHFGNETFSKQQAYDKFL